MDVQSFRYRIRASKEEVEKNLEELKSISDLKVKCAKLKFFIDYHSNNFSSLENSKPSELFYDSTDGLGSYNSKIYELKRLEKKISQKFNSLENKNDFVCNYCLIPPTTPCTWNDKNFCNQHCLTQWQLPCDECGNYCKGNNWQIDKADNKKFCSEQCCNLHYAETCDKCQQKTLGHTYYSDVENKTGTLCSKCNKAEIKENKREIEKIRKELNQSHNTLENNQEDLEEEMKVYCRFCNDECSSIFSVCKKEECLLKNDKEIESDNSNLTIERERERAI